MISLDRSNRSFDRENGGKTWVSFIKGALTDMSYLFAIPAAKPEIHSSDLAAQLRTGPIRAILDRLVRSAAEAAGVPYVMVGVCYPNAFEFIATHGIPLTYYQDRFPLNALSPQMFAHELEFRDLQKEPHFAEMSKVPIVKTWRYGANAPIRLQSGLPDGGVLSLSCADTVVREGPVKVLSVLRGYADLISDLIWLSSQVERAALANDPISIIKAVLEAGLARVNIPVCIVDAQLKVVSLSKSLGDMIAKIGGPGLQDGEQLSGTWLGSDVRNVVLESLADAQPRRWLRINDQDSDRLMVDVFPFAFAEIGNFGVLAFHNGEQAFAFVDSQRSNEVRDVREAENSWGNDGAGPVSRFLLDTLISGQRLVRTGSISYIGLRRWRTPIKAYQIDALRALKAEIPEGLLTAVANEMADTIQSVYGDVSNCVVVPVPCGSSGDDCFSCRLSARLARILDVPMITAFSPIATPKGSSHPRRNIGRARMKLLRTVDQPVILVDDVATSGSHINEAATLLRASAPQVWPIVWISG